MISLEKGTGPLSHHHSPYLSTICPEVRVGLPSLTLRLVVTPLQGRGYDFAASQELLGNLTAGLERDELAAFQERLAHVRGSQPSSESVQLQLAEPGPHSNVRRRRRAHFLLPQRRVREFILGLLRWRRRPSLAEISAQEDDDTTVYPPRFQDVQA